MPRSGLLFLLFLSLASCGCDRKVLPPARAQAVLARVKEAHAAGQWSRVPGLAKPLLKAHPRTEGSEEALFLVADAETHRGRETAAYRAYETLVTEHPRTGRLKEVSRLEFDLASARYAQGKERLKGHFMNRGTPITHVLESAARHDPYADHAPYALLLVASVHYDAGRFEDADPVLDRLLADHPRSPWTAQAEFLRAMSAYRQFRGAPYDIVPLKTAEERFRQYLDRHPDGQDVDAARRMLVVIGDRWAEHGVSTAGFYRVLGQPEASALYLKDVVSRWPDSPWAEKARAQLGSR